MSIIPVVVEAVLLKSKYGPDLEMLLINGPMTFDLKKIEDNILSKAASMEDLAVSDYTFVDETGVEYNIKLVSEADSRRNKKM